MTPKPGPRKPTGRPLGLTTEIQEAMMQAVSAGAYMETAAAYAGITKDTLYRWLKRGARARRELGRGKRITVDDRRLVAFSDALKKAAAAAEVADLKIIGKAARRTWQAAAWRLERKHPDRWGRRDRVYVGDADSVTEEEADPLARISRDPESRRLLDALALRVESEPGGDGE